MVSSKQKVETKNDIYDSQVEEKKLRTILNCCDENGEAMFKNIAIFGSYGYRKTTVINDVYNKNGKTENDDNINNSILINVELSNYLNINKEDKSVNLPAYVSEIIIMKIESISKPKYTLYTTNSYSRVSNFLNYLKILIAVTYLIVISVFVWNHIMDLEISSFKIVQFFNYKFHLWLVILFGFILFVLYNFVTQIMYRRDIKKIKIKYNEIEFDDKFKNKTLSNYYVDVIAYLADFHINEKNIVISFEDIDRLVDNEPIEYLDFLRNLNYSLNAIYSKHNFIFLYSLRELKDNLNVQNKFFDKSVNLHPSRGAKKILDIITYSYKEPKFNIYYKKKPKFNIYYKEEPDASNNFERLLTLKLVKEFFDEIDGEYTLDFLNDYREINNFTELLYSTLDLEIDITCNDRVLYELFFGSVFKMLTIHTKSVVQKLEKIFDNKNYNFQEHYIKNLSLSLTSEFDIEELNVLEVLLKYMYVELPKILFVDIADNTDIIDLMIICDNAQKFKIDRNISNIKKEIIKNHISSLEKSKLCGIYVPMYIFRKQKYKITANKIKSIGSVKPINRDIDKKLSEFIDNLIIFKRESDSEKPNKREIYSATIKDIKKIYKEISNELEYEIEFRDSITFLLEVNDLIDIKLSRDYKNKLNYLKEESNKIILTYNDLLIKCKKLLEVIICSNYNIDKMDCFRDILGIPRI